MYHNKNELSTWDKVWAKKAKMWSSECYCFNWIKKRTAALHLAKLAHQNHYKVNKCKIKSFRQFFLHVLFAALTATYSHLMLHRPLETLGNSSHKLKRSTIYLCFFFSSRILNLCRSKITLNFFALFWRREKVLETLNKVFPQQLLQQVPKKKCFAIPSEKWWFRIKMMSMTSKHRSKSFVWQFQSFNTFLCLLAHSFVRSFSFDLVLHFSSYFLGSLCSCVRKSVCAAPHFIYIFVHFSFHVPPARVNFVANWRRWILLIMCRALCSVRIFALGCA